jgi:hypothetical protein
MIFQQSFVEKPYKCGYNSGHALNAEHDEVFFKEKD